MTHAQRDTSLRYFYYYAQPDAPSSRAPWHDRAYFDNRKPSATLAAHADAGADI